MSLNLTKMRYERRLRRKTTKRFVEGNKKLVNWGKILASEKDI